MTMADSPSKHRITRRALLRGGLLATGGLAMAGPFAALVLRQRAPGNEQAPVAQVHGPYGPVSPVRDATTGLSLLALPRGFRYHTVGWTGDPMDDGSPTPARHDGMAVVQGGEAPGQRLVLMRNHEETLAPLIGGGHAPAYDAFSAPSLGVPGLGGGTTALLFDGGRLVSSQPTLGGTLVNCAGGATPWHSWLTCEEIVVDGQLIGGRTHGFVFEVPSPLIGQASAQPIVDMGLMAHEAAAVDPLSGFVYLTEDNGSHSGFYRYRPDDHSRQAGALARGGTLEMLKVVDEERKDLRRVAQGERFGVEWVEIADPSRFPDARVAASPPLPPLPLLFDGPSGPFAQGSERGAACFDRLEGCWYHDHTIYFTDTSGGAASGGALWAYRPRGAEPASGQLTALAVASDPTRLDRFDNVTLSPNGGILLCEDNSRAQGCRLVGLDANGHPFEFARNNMLIEHRIPGRGQIAPADYRSSEFAGATFDPGGRFLFVNIQTPGVTFVITGPWHAGPLV